MLYVVECWIGMKYCMMWVLFEGGIVFVDIVIVDVCCVVLDDV